MESRLYALRIKEDRLVGSTPVKAGDCIVVDPDFDPEVEANPGDVVVVEGNNLVEIGDEYPGKVAGCRGIVIATVHFSDTHRSMTERLNFVYVPAEGCGQQPSL